MILKKKNFGSKGKILIKINFQYLRKYSEKINTFAKISQNIFAYSSVSEHSKHASFLKIGIYFSLQFYMNLKIAFFSPTPEPGDML